MVSRTRAASPSAPLRKSTGLVATITRTAPVGPITRWLSTHVAPPSKSWRPRRGRPAPSRHLSRLRSFRRWPRLCTVAPSVAEQETIPHPQLPARTAPRQPQRLSIDAASQTTAAVITRGAEPPHRQSLRSLRSQRQSGPCLHRATSAAAPRQ